jgi:hypothetical protein
MSLPRNRLWPRASYHQLLYICFVYPVRCLALQAQQRASRCLSHQAKLPGLFCRIRCCAYQIWFQVAVQNGDEFLFWYNGIALRYGEALRI